jgi:uncharacterized membrane-anchored protein YitT (DUF2179 family)
MSQELRLSAAQINTAQAAAAPRSGSGHTTIEDLLALFAATIMIGLGITLYKAAGLLTGGIAGLAFLVHYALHATYGWAFFVLNLPFYWLAVKRLGWAFTLRTFAAIALLSVMTELPTSALGIGSVHPLYASAAGGVLLGTGILMLFRHRASVGGIGIVAMYLQESRGWRAGYVQLAFDSSILLTSILVVDLGRVAWSILSAVILNMILSLNHRPGRYQA